MNSVSQKTVTIIEAGRQTAAPVQLENSIETDSSYPGDFDDGLVWTSWLDDSELWNLGLEYLDYHQ